MKTETTKRTVNGGARGFAEGVLLELVGALREMDDGEVVVVTSREGALGADLEAWSRITGHAIVSHAPAAEGAASWTVRKGVAQFPDEPPREIGSRLWLYTNFDCNLRCEYCCVRSSPRAERRALGVETVHQIAEEARALAVGAIYLTGGEPFLLKEIGELIELCSAAAPTTVLTNGMLFTGSRAEILDRVRRDAVTFQISLDSATPDLHDLHRGQGSWKKALAGVRFARERGFRVRLAATVSSDRDEESFRAFLDREGVAEEDRVVRRVALRGFAEEGVALAKADLVPEVTITARGVYWHPVGADDEDFLVRARIFPLAESFAAVREEWRRQRALHTSIVEIFRCA